jgi:putative heme-binding domain-containing protein
MPAADTMSSREIWQVAGYVRSLGRLPAESVPGDAGRGENLYRTKGNCVQCHVVAGDGGTLGPELSEIGARRGVDKLRSVVLNPESAIPGGFLQVRVVTGDGRQILGVRLNEDTFTIQVRDLNGHLYSFVKANLKELQKQPGKTPMPSFRQVFSDAELDDLIAYLVSLKGRP